jgi:hypothetical protein
MTERDTEYKIHRGIQNTGHYSTAYNTRYQSTIHNIGHDSTTQNTDTIAQYRTQGTIAQYRIQDTIAQFRIRTQWHNIQNTECRITHHNGTYRTIWNTRDKCKYRTSQHNTECCHNNCIQSIGNHSSIQNIGHYRTIRKYTVSYSIK